MQKDILACLWFLTYHKLRTSETCRKHTTAHDAAFRQDTGHWPSSSACSTATVMASAEPTSPQVVLESWHSKDTTTCSVCTVTRLAVHIAPVKHPTHQQLNVFTAAPVTSTAQCTYSTCQTTVTQVAQCYYSTCQITICHTSCSVLSQHLSNNHLSHKLLSVITAPVK